VGSGHDHRQKRTGQSIGQDEGAPCEGDLDSQYRALREDHEAFTSIKNVAAVAEQLSKLASARRSCNLDLI
jgi:hypothetical protein